MWIYPEHEIRLAEAANYERDEPEPEMAHPRLLRALLVVTGWTAFIGAGYSIYRAVEAVFG